MYWLCFLPARGFIKFPRHLEQPYLHPPPFLSYQPIPGSAMCQKFPSKPSPGMWVCSPSDWDTPVPSISQILRSCLSPWTTASTGQVQLTRTHISLALYWRGCKGRLSIWNVPFYLYFLFSFLLCLCLHLSSDPRNNPDAMRGWHYFWQLGFLHLCFSSFHLQRFANNPCTLILCLLSLHYLQRGA